MDSIQEKEYVFLLLVGPQIIMYYEHYAIANIP